MVVYFVIFQILPTFVYELFETMQSSVTRSRTFITKSLPASFQTLYIHFIFRELQQNTLFSTEETNCSFMLEQSVLPYWNTLFCLDKTDCFL